MLANTLLLLSAFLPTAPQATPDTAVNASVQPSAQEERPASDSVLPADLGLPSETSAEAEALWRQVLLSVGADARLNRPVRSFEAPIQVLLQQKDAQGSPAGQLETKIGIRYLSLGQGNVREYVDFSYEGDARLIYGPSSYWLIEKDRRTRLVGREHLESRKRVNQTKTLARNFSQLTDLINLQIFAMELIETPAKGTLPKVRGILPSRFQWLEVETPNFEITPREGRDRGDASVYTVRFGIERQEQDGQELFLPRFVYVTERPFGDDNQEPAPNREPARELFIDVVNFAQLADLRVPQQLNLFERTPGLLVGREWNRVPDQQIFLLQGLRLDAPLTPEDFDPRTWGKDNRPDPAHSGNNSGKAPAPPVVPFKRGQPEAEESESEGSESEESGNR